MTDSRNRAAVLGVARAAVDSGTFQVILTSREHISAKYLDWLPRVTLAAFDDHQLRELAAKWLGLEEQKRFFTDLQLANDLRELVRVPLLANLTLALFKQIGALPESRVKLYEMFVQLLCGGWDAAKNIRRDTEFGPGPKRTVIARIAWLTHENENRDFSLHGFRAAVGQTLGGLADKYELLLRECIQDGILVRNGERFAFAHLSFQEFLAAKELTGPNTARLELAVRRFLDGNTWWEEVIRFYLAAVEDPSEAVAWLSRLSEYVASRTHRTPAEVQARAEGLVKYMEGCHKGFRPETSVLRRIRRERRPKPGYDLG